MNDIDQVKNFIRFSIDQLSARNAHHQFEDIAFHIARKRIASNIIPATGPVSAGGDQGRDIETFHTYLQQNFSAGSIFLSLVANQPVVFACSLNKEYKRKIKDDIISITQQGTPVERIYFFSGSDIPVAARHELSAWSLEEHQVALEIQDAQAISIFLTDPDLFWLAVKHLNVPSEYYLTRDEENWYSLRKKNWNTEDNRLLTLAWFLKVKESIRHIYKDPELKADLPFWVQELEKHLPEIRTYSAKPECKDYYTILKRDILYEICASPFISFESLHGKEDYLIEYFSDFLEHQKPNKLEDATVLLKLLYFAYLNHLVDRNKISEENINEWLSGVENSIHKNIQEETRVSQKCLYLNLKATFSYYFPFMLADPEHFLESVSQCLEEIVTILPQAPLFPLEHLTNHVEETISAAIRDRKAAEIAGFSMNLERLEKVAKQIDLFWAERVGNFEAAAKCRNRAILYFKAGDYPDALQLSFECVTKWYSDETLRGSILSILMSSQCYYLLNMDYAAKYYSLAAAYIVLHSEKRLPLQKYFVEALMHAASCDYRQGAWNNFFSMFLDSAKLFQAVHDNGMTKNVEDYTNGIRYVTIIFCFVKQFAPELFPKIEKIGKTNEEVYDLVMQNLSDIEKQFADKATLWEECQKNFIGKPLSDLGPKRLIRWQAFGIHWEISFKNEYYTAAVAEQVAAILQILLVALAKIDMCWICPLVHIRPAAMKKTL